LITPTIIRNLTRPDLNQSEYFGGTGNVTSDKPLRLRPARQISRPARTAPIIESNTEPAVNEEADAAIEAPASGSGAPSENQPAPENNPAPAATLRPGVQQKPRGLFEPPLEVAAEANKKALAN